MYALLCARVVLCLSVVVMDCDLMSKNGFVWEVIPGMHYFKSIVCVRAVIVYANPGLLGMSMMAGESVGRRLATAIANWNNDPRRFVRLALMMYLVLSMFVLISALHAANPRMPLISWLGLFALFFLVSFRIAQVLVHYRRLAVFAHPAM
jgi:hypothetical protein